MRSWVRPFTFAKGSSPNFAPCCIKTWIWDASFSNALE